VRAMALAANIFIFHLLGDVPSAPLIGYMSDHFTMRIAFVAPVLAICLSSAILFYGMKFAPVVSAPSKTDAVGAH
jgi:Na+/melibiose symporter-like transporter